MDYKDSVAKKYAGMIETRLESFRKGNNISEKNKELILGFLRKCELRDGIQEKRVLKTISSMTRIAEMLGKDLDQTTQLDIENLVTEIKRKYKSDWTRHDFFVFIKKFYKYQEGNFVDFPSKVRWIKGGRNRSREAADVYLTQDEVTRMIAAGANSFEKAAFATLYDGGFRYSEWAGIQRKHVSFEDSIAKVTVTGKTGRRTVPLLICEHYLACWMEEMREKGPDAFVFANRAWNYERKPLSGTSLGHIIERMASRAGVSGKKLNPHAIRHARMTYMANFLSSSQLCDFSGWVQGSSQMQTYVHSSELDQRIRSNLGLHGSKPLEQDAVFKTKVCPRCGRDNTGTAEMCINCGKLINERAAMEYEKGRKTYADMMQEMVRTEVRRMLKEKGREDIIEKEGL